jgi:hypothetical protein
VIREARQEEEDEVFLRSLNFGEAWVALNRPLLF